MANRTKLCSFLNTTLMSKPLCMTNVCIFRSYVEQRDILMGTLTVREMLLYTAMLRLPAHGFNNADDIARANSRVCAH